MLSTIKNLSGVPKFIIAAGIYVCFAAYLFLPHFTYFDTSQYFLPINICIGCLGCYVLSRRWVGTFVGSLVAGAIYGFGPYVLGLLRFHPIATLLAAAIPWLFCPAASIQKRELHWLSVLLSTLPFVVIILFFKATMHLRLFPVPIQAKVYLHDLNGLLAPMLMTGRRITLVGFYHVPAAFLIMGISMLLAAERKGIILIIVLGTLFALLGPQLNLFTEVSPIIWLSIPVLCCSVLIGEGLHGLALAGRSDRQWVLAVVFFMGTLTIVTLLLATKYAFVFAGLGKDSAKLLADTAKLYLLGTLAVSVIYFMASAKKRLLYLRWLVLCSAMAVDMFFSARFIVDSLLVGSF